MSPRLFGRELDRPESAVTVRVRDGRPVLGDGPLAEAGDLLDGLDVIECADLDAAVRAVRSVDADSTPDGLGQTPYLLLAWLGEARTELVSDRSLIDAIEAWRRDADAHGRYVMGSSFGGIEAASTQRLRDRRSLEADSPFTEVDHVSFAIDVVLCADRRQAVAFATTHPLARTDAIEVRPFRTPG